MKKFMHVVPAAIFALALASCGGDSKDKQEADSLRNVVNALSAEKQSMDLFLDAVNTGMDSLVNAEGNVLRTSGESPLSKKEQIKKNLELYSSMMSRQKERLEELENALKGTKGANYKMLKTIESLKQQLAEKDSIIGVLNTQLAQNKLDIDRLTAQVNNLSFSVNRLTEQTQAQEQTITEQANQMNEAYVLIGSKKELKAAGVLTGGNLFKKSKLDLSQVDASKFTKIDIRETNEFIIKSKKPTIMSQAPAGSYTLKTQKDGTSVLTITDAKAFWSVTNFLVVRY